jgi:hypothetical protein
LAVKRKIPEAHPPPAGAFYAFKIASLPTGAGPLDLYVGMRDGWIAPMVSDVTDGEAMRQLAKHGAGHELRCEKRLAKAGKRHGFEPAEAPDWVSTVRSGLVVCMALGPSMGPDCMLPAGELAKASSKFLRGAPWQHWHSDLPMKFEVSGLVERTFEGCVMGSGGSEYGIALYEEPGAMEKLVTLHKAGREKDARQMRCIAVTFDAAPDFAAEALQQVIGAPILPMPTRVERGKMGAPAGGEILVLAAALVAASGLTPSTPVSIGGVSDGRGSVTVKVTAPSKGA